MSESTDQRLEALEAENRFLKERLELLTENVPLGQEKGGCCSDASSGTEGLLCRVLDHLGCGFLRFNSKGNLVHLNSTASGFLGFDPETVRGKACRDVLGACSEHLHHVYSTGQDIADLDLTLQSIQGRPFPARVCMAAIPGMLGDDGGAVVAFEDRSRMRALSEQAGRVNTLTALGEMSATIAHEIRNPLGGIGGFAGLLERDMSLNDPNRRLVKKIIEGVAGLNRMVTSLLNYTRPPHLNLRPVDAGEMVEECLGFFEIDAGARIDEIDIERRLPDAPLMCRADPEHIQQILLNLLHNAVQAMPGGGRLTVAASETEGRGESGTGSGQVFVALAISDTGMGMTDEIRSKLFMPFFTTKENGNGLGLATAKKIIEAHGGDLLVETRANAGTTFTVYIPR